MPDLDLRKRPNISNDYMLKYIQGDKGEMEFKVHAVRAVADVG